MENKNLSYRKKLMFNIQISIYFKIIQGHRSLKISEQRSKKVDFRSLIYVVLIALSNYTSK